MDNSKNLMIGAVVAIVVIVAGAVLLGPRLMRKISTMTGSNQPAPATETSAPTPTPTPEAQTTNTGSPSGLVVEGKVLTDGKGMTLYTYDKDTVGVSNCSGQCLVNWPAFKGTGMMPNLPANLAVIPATEQFAWKGRPLYFFAGDKKSGDMNGDGVGGVWHVVKP